jgi:hypothetical protein
MDAKGTQREPKGAFLRNRSDQVRTRVRRSKDNYVKRVAKWSQQRCKDTSKNSVNKYWKEKSKSLKLFFWNVKKRLYLEGTEFSSFFKWVREMVNSRKHIKNESMIHPKIDTRFDEWKDVNNMCWRRGTGRHFLVSRALLKFMFIFLYIYIYIYIYLMRGKPRSRHRFELRILVAYGGNRYEHFKSYPMSYVPGPLEQL